MGDGIEVGLVGCGRWGRNILRDLSRLGCAVIVVDTDPEARLEAVAAGAHVGEMTDLAGVGGVVIATPPTTHAEVLDRLTGLGVPAFVEKPMTVSVGDAERVVDQWGDRLFVMDKWRYHPGIERMGALAALGRLGAIRGVSTVRTGWGHGHRDVDVTWALASHDLSIARELLGAAPLPVWCAAELRPWGAAAMRAGLGAEPWHALEVSVVASERRRQFRLHGDEGVAVLDDLTDAVEVISGDPRSAAQARRERFPFAADPPLRRELEAFVRHIEGGPPPKSSGRDGLDVVRAIEALRSLAGLDEDH